MRTEGEIAALVAALCVAGCNPSGLAGHLDSLPQSQLLLEVGDGGLLEARIAYDAGPTCFAVSSVDASIDGVEAQVVSLGQPYMDFNGDPACQPPQFKIPAPAGPNPATQVAISDSTRRVTARFEGFEAVRTAAIAGSGDLVAGEPVTLSLQPETDLLDPGQTSIAFAAPDGSVYPLASGAQLDLSPGALTFAMPSGVPIGSGSLLVVLGGTALPLECDGVDSCTAVVEAAISVPATVAAPPG